MCVMRSVDIFKTKKKHRILKTCVADSHSLMSGNPDLNLATVHPEFEEFKVGKKVKAKHHGDSPQVRVLPLVFRVRCRDRSYTTVGGNFERGGLANCHHYEYVPRFMRFGMEGCDMVGVVHYSGIVRFSSGKADPCFSCRDRN